MKLFRSQAGLPVPQGGTQAGISLLEVIIAMCIITVVIVMSIHFIVGTQTAVIMNQDRAFAIQKALNIVNELRAYAQSNEEAGGASSLDIFDDGVGTSKLLTIDSTISDPASIMSGNSWLGDRWRYARRITVRKFPSFEASNVRIVEVKVFLTQPGKDDASNLADISSVVTTSGDSAPPKQVYDIYLLCMENIPGWWVYMAYLKPFIETALSDMESRNPGMEFRQHWITKAAYGRDREYKPYFNDAVDSNADINYAYFYPGSMPTGSAVSQYYVPANVNARINIDNATTNDYDDNTTILGEPNPLYNPYPYTLADQYNHAMRFPDENDLYNLRNSVKTEEKTYRLLLDDMVLNPNNYKNAIFINLHGELIPMPSIRNYSDAAKDPATYPQWRVVTHPEKLRCALTDAVKLRVYGYLADPSIAGNNYMTVPISIVVPSMDLTQSGDISIQAIRGGTDQEPVDAVADTYSLVSPTPKTTSGVRMYYTLNYDAISDTTTIKLYYTPLRTPATADNRGLSTTWRLYGMDYIPTTCEAANNFSTVLTSTAVTPKNTARWILTIPAAVVDSESTARGLSTSRVLPFQTRIGDDLTTGVMWPVKNKPPNLSTTYIWRNNDANTVPFSERYQFQGDPRHMPYADVKLAHGYNRYFDNMRNSLYNDLTPTNYWPAISATLINNGTSATADGWHGASGTAGDMMEIDVPRFFQFIRTALTGSNGVWTTITGWSYYYMGLGNEIGYDSANGFANSIPTSSKPFNGASGTRYEQSILSENVGLATACGVKYIRENVSPYWWGMPWLGELYPDTVYTAQWAVNGNLNTGSGANTFVRIRRQSITTTGAAPIAKSGSLPRATSFYTTGTAALACVRRTNQYGCTSFFNIGTTTSTFRHKGGTGSTGSITVSGTNMANAYAFPLQTSMDINRPFDLDYNWTAVPNEFSVADYAALRCQAEILRGLRFYGHVDGASWEGSSLVRLQNNSMSGTPSAFLAVNGIAQTVQMGTSGIARYSVISLMHSLFSAGLPGTPSRIVQLPRVEIKQPNVTTELENPTNITMTWSTDWKRWDKQKYTSEYSDTFTETITDIRYALIYSRDNGRTWLHMIDDNFVKPEPSALVGDPNQTLWQNDAAPDGDESFFWDVSDTAYFPEGNYIIRLEAYRNNQLTHYAYHEQRIYINR